MKIATVSVQRFRYRSNIVRDSDGHGHPGGSFLVGLETAADGSVRLHDQSGTSGLQLQAASTSSKASPSMTSSSTALWRPSLGGLTPGW